VVGTACCYQGPRPVQILLVSDIHANRQALEAVLERFAAADEVWCLGDIVEYGPCPAECIELVRRHCRLVVQGNHDVSFATPGAAGWGQHDRHTVAPEARDYLLGLPAARSMTVDGVSYLVVHGSPQDPLSGSLRPGMAAERLREAVAGCREDRVLCAHTHTAMIAEADGRLVVNTGTVGQPRDGDYRAQCMVLEDGALRFERVPYDLDALARDYERSPLPPPVKEEWLRYTREGVVDVHGLQLGPFSHPATEET